MGLMTCQLMEGGMYTYDSEVGRTSLVVTYVTGQTQLSVSSDGSASPPSVSLRKYGKNNKRKALSN